MLGFVALVAVNVALFLAAFRVLTPAAVSTRALRPGAVTGGIGYSILLTLGTALVQHQLKHAQAVYGQFGFVLGLMAWLALVAQLTVYAAELNVVVDRHLWPRGIAKPPTDADDRVLRDLAHEQTRREDEKVAVGFAPDPVADAIRDARRPSSSRRSAITGGLRYVHDDDPGYGRRRSGRGFTYLDTHGRPITSAAKVERIKALAIPPAWADVWICPSEHGHLQATGRDAKGRKQYRYHPEWRAVQEEMKFDRLIDFGEALPAIRERMDHDLARRGLPRDKVIATVVHLLEASLIRVGNEEYAKANGSYGLTTLRDPHVRLEGSDIRFRFAGKSGQRHEITVHDARTARIVRQCRDLPGQRLFQYVDEDGKQHKLESGDVNDYLRDVSGADFTAKDFRTWVGTLLAATALAALEPPDSDTAGRRQAAAAIEVVARHLGNTPTIARASYVHPDIVDLYVEGDLPELWTKRGARDSKWLLAEERRLLRVLRTARRRQARDGRVAA